VRSEEERQRSLAIVDQEARRLTNLVENLLYFSRAEQEPARITPVPTSLAPLIREVVDGFAPLARARDMSIRFVSFREVAGRIDSDALRQILINLLDNAVKYGPPGQMISVELGTVDGRARITVEDAGPGIPPPERQHVWERFWRLPRDRESNIAGTGIGLSIVRELVALHGGVVTIEDGAEGGARFVVSLAAISSIEAPDGALEPAP